MTTLATTVDNTSIRNDIHSYSFPSDDSAVIASVITTISHRHKLSPAKVWVVSENFEGSDESEVAIIAMNAQDFLFIYNLQSKSMITQIPYTPSSIIRMTMTDGLIRVWFVDPKKQQDAVVLATWDNAWIVHPNHRWLWQCIESQLSTWLMESYKKLKQMSI